MALASPALNALANSATRPRSAASSCSRGTAGVAVLAAGGSCGLAVHPTQRQTAVKRQQPARIGKDFIEDDLVSAPRGAITAGVWRGRREGWMIPRCPEGHGPRDGELESPRRLCDGSRRLDPPAVNQQSS